MAHHYIYEAHAWDDYNHRPQQGQGFFFQPNANGRHVYNPASEPSLVSFFAKLGHVPYGWRKNEHAYSTFLRCFGVLGDSGKETNTVSRDLSVASEQHQAVGAMSYHAFMVNWILQSVYDAQECVQHVGHDEVLCLAQFQALPMSVIPIRHGGVQPRLSKVDVIKCLEGGMSKKDLATELLDSFFTSALAGVSRECRRGIDVFVFKSLLQLIYWRLRDDIQRFSLRRCQTCTSLFFVTDKRQLYCPPLPQMRESSCGKKGVVPPIKFASDRAYRAWMDAGWGSLTPHWPRLAHCFA